LKIDHVVRRPLLSVW